MGDGRGPHQPQSNGHDAPPKIAETPPAVLRDEALSALLKVVEADKTFAGRRDAAILRVFMATGARLSEITNLRWNPDDSKSNDVDLDAGLIRVVGKGNRERPMYLGAKAVKALDRYIFDQRAKHPQKASPWLWLGPRGRFTSSGIAQMVRARGEAASLEIRVRPGMSKGMRVKADALRGCRRAR